MAHKLIRDVVAQVRSLLRLRTAGSRSRERLRASEERLRLAQEAGGIGIFDWDLSSGEVFWTRELEAIYGMAAPADPITRAAAWAARLHPDEREWIAEATRRWLASPVRELVADYRFLRPDGEERWIASRSVAFRDRDGRAVRVVGTQIDVTERKRVEEELRDALESTSRREAEIESIYDSAPIGLCILDEDGRFVRVNQRLAAMNGPSPEAHVGRTLREVVPGVADLAEQLLRQVITTGMPVRGVELVGEVPGRPGVVGTWIENWHPIKNAAGAVVGVNVGVEDVTRLKRVEEDLRAANQVKDDFLATLSHELRTPLTAILGWTQLLLRGQLTAAAAREALEAVARNAEAQRQLIADVLDVSRMMAGKLRLHMTPVDLGETVRLVVESMRPAADHKNVDLELSCEVTPAVAEADASRLQQIVWNLLSNAIKFTPHGGRVGVVLRKAGGMYELQVQDTGVGIRPEFLPRVFDRFVQADSSTTRRHTGLGLGLSIVRQLVELHGGQVTVASRGESLGATFTVTLPLRATPAMAISPADGGDSSPTRPGGTPLAGLRVLVVDDQQDARLVTAAFVRQAGGFATSASSASEALEQMALARPDVVIADLAMPEMDGYQFVGRLRSLASSAGGHVPAIALTAYEGAEHRARSREAGFSGHLSKPVNPDELTSAILVATGRIQPEDAVQPKQT